MAIDVTKMNVSKSDQLNAVDLAGSDLQATITAARETGDAKQPLALHIDSWGQPFKPCKSVRRLLAAAWGQPDAEQWVGRSLLLYLDPTVKWAGEAAGGVRVKAVSHIDQPFTMMLPESSKSRKRVTVTPLKVDAPPTLAGICSNAGITLAQLDTWHRGKWGNPAPVDGTTTAAELAVFLAGNPGLIREVKQAAEATLGSDADGGEE